MQPVYRAATLFDAHLACGFLRAAGIEAVVADPGEAAWGGHRLPGERGPTVCVLDATRAEEAEALLAERDGAAPS